MSTTSTKKKIKMTFFFNHPVITLLNVCVCGSTRTQLLSHVLLFATPWAIARQFPLSVEFSRQEYWSGLPLPPPGDLPDPGIEPISPALSGEFFTIESPGKPNLVKCLAQIPRFLFTREGNGTPLQYSCLENPMDGGAWWAAVHGVAKSRTRLSDFTFTFHFHALEKEMATHSSVLARRIPGMGEPGGLPSMGLHRVGHD